MNVKQKKAAVNMYQLSVYVPPSTVKDVHTREERWAELEGISYPYRIKGINIEWMDLFAHESQNKKRR